MKNLQYFTTLLFFVGINIATNAQDTIINRNISVEREYRPVIQDAGKVNTVPTVVEPVVEKQTVKYSDFNLPLNADYNIHTLAAAELSNEKPTNKEGFARVGFGNYLNTLANFAYPIVNKADMRLDVSLNHLGTFESKRMHSTSHAALSFDKLFKKFNLYAQLGGGHEYVRNYGNTYNSDGIVDFNLYSSDYQYAEINRAGVNSDSRTFLMHDFINQPFSDTFWRFNSTIGIHSLVQENDIQYKAEVNYNIFNSINGATENQLHTVATISLPSDKNRMGMDVEIYNFMYSSVNILEFSFWDRYSVLMLNPYYSIDRPNWNVRLGMKSSFAFVHGNFANPSLDVRAEWKVLPKYFSVYGAITGDYEVNTLDKTFAENPYLFSDIRINDTYSPYKLIAGIKLKPIHNLLVDAFVDFRQIDNQYFYTNKEYKRITPILPLPLADTLIYSNRFNVIYRSASLFRIGVRANYSIQNLLNVELKGTYNGWNVTNELHGWNKPTYEAEINTTVKINPNLNVSANAYYQSGRFAKLGEKSIAMNDKIDINLGANYAFNSWFNAFLKVNNLINSQYQNFYGYDLQGFNVMVGAAFSF